MVYKLLATILFILFFTAGVANAAPHGTVLDFDGDDYLVASDNAVFDQNDRLSISVWVKPDAGSDDYILYRANAYYLKITSTCAIEGAIYYSSTFTGHTVESSAITCDGSAWTHIEMTYDKDDGELKLYIDSVLKDTESHTTAISDTNTPLYIASDSTPANYFDGKIDDVRLYQYARSASDVRLDYNEGLASHFGPREKTCSEDPAGCMDYGLVGYWNFDEGTGQMAYDNSDNNNDGTLGGSSSIETSDPVWIIPTSPPSQGGVKGSALSFDGVDDYVDCGSDDSLKMTDAVTISLWLKTTQTGRADPVTRWPNSSPYPGYGLSISNGWGGCSTGQIGIWVGDITDRYLCSNTAVNDGNWHYIVGTYDGTTAKMYIDGVLDNSGARTNGLSSDTSLYFALHQDGSSRFDGLIDEVRIYNRALSAEEIRYHYNRGGPVAHWKFDEGSGTTAYDETGNNNDGTLTNMDDDDWVEGKYGGALDFDGSNDYVEVPTNGISPDQGTVVAWVCPHILGNEDYIFCHYDSGNRIYMNDYDGFRIGIGSSANVDTGIDFVIDAWQQVVLVWNNGEYFAYYNGEEVKNGSYTGLDSIAPTARLGNWASGGFNFNGTIDDVRIYNYARTAEQILQDYNGGKGVYFK